MKSLLSDLYRKLGFLVQTEPTVEADASPRTPDQIARAREAFAGLRRLQEDLRRQGVTAEDVRSWIRHGRE